MLNWFEFLMDYCKFTWEDIWVSVKFGASQGGHLDMARNIPSFGDDHPGYPGFEECIDKDTALCRASMAGNIDMIKGILHEHRSDHHWPSKDQVFKCIISYALERGHVEIVQFMLDLGTPIPDKFLEFRYNIHMFMLIYTTVTDQAIDQYERNLKIFQIIVNSGNARLEKLRPVSHYIRDLGDYVHFQDDKRYTRFFVNAFGHERVVSHFYNEFTTQIQVDMYNTTDLDVAHYMNIVQNGNSDERCTCTMSRVKSRAVSKN